MTFHSVKKYQLPLSSMDMPPLSDLSPDQKTSKHRKKTPLYAQPQPNDPEMRIRWHRARVTEKYRRERNLLLQDVGQERDVLKSQLLNKDAIMNELRLKLANSEAINASRNIELGEVHLKLANSEANILVLKARNIQLGEKLIYVTHELAKKQERIDGEWILLQNLIKTSMNH